MNNALETLISHYGDLDEVLYWSKKPAPANSGFRLRATGSKRYGKALILTKKASPLLKTSALRMYEFCLQREGLEVFWARTAQEMVDVISAHHIDVVVVDWDQYQNYAPGILKVIDQVISNFGLNHTAFKAQLLAVTPNPVSLKDVYAYSDLKAVLRPGAALSEVAEQVKRAAKNLNLGGMRTPDRPLSL